MHISKTKFIRATLNKCKKMSIALRSSSLPYGSNDSSKRRDFERKSCCFHWCFWLTNQASKHQRKTTTIIPQFENCYFEAYNQTRNELKRGLQVPRDVPKGHMALYVGKNMKRFVIKISLLKEPLFVALLDLSRNDEHDDDSTPVKLWIPCDEAMFLDVVRCASSTSKDDHCCWKIGLLCL